MKNFHLPLPAPFYEEFMQEAKNQGRAATKLAREILESWHAEQKKRRIAQDIAAFVREHAGTELDHDPALEKSSLETLSQGS